MSKVKHNHKEASAKSEHDRSDDSPMGDEAANHRATGGEHPHRDGSGDSGHGGRKDAGSDGGSQDVASLREQLAAKDQELREGQEKYLRTIADLDNVRKRLRQEKEDAINFANMNLVLQFLPIIDNLELALQHSETNRDFDVLLQGVRQILKQMQDTLRKEGVEPIETVGKPFDPNEHEAVGHAQSEEYPEGHIAQDLRTGYRMKGRAIRPSIVRVVG